MKYSRLIIIAGAIIIVFAAAAISYNYLSSRDSNEITGSSHTSAAAEVSSATSASSKDSSAASSSSKESTTASTSAKESSAASVSAKEGVKIGDLAYDFTLTNYSGEKVTLSSLRGKLVILNFWASWCGPCQNEMPEFQALQDKFDIQGASPDTVFLTVNLTDGQMETRDTAQAFLDEKGYTFPVVFDDGDKTANLYQISGIPSTFILDKNGVIVQTFLGGTNQKSLEKALESAKS